MISRRLLRIKVLQVLYAYYKSDQKDINLSEKELFFSIGKAYELYHFILLLFLEIVDYAEARIDLARNKKVPSFDDLNPNTNFIDNKFIAQLRSNADLKTFAENNKINWVQNPEFVKEVFNLLQTDQDYIDYMELESADYAADKKLFVKICTDIILPNESLCILLEEKSIYWNDDLDFIVSMLVKTIKQFKPSDGEEKKLLELYKNEEDKDYVKMLFRKSIAKRDFCLQLIEEKASNWDLERIAFMDVIIMQLAITELMEFNSIPTKVTLNEYLEITKYYSTEKSNSFINGVLDKIMQQLKTDKKIKKTGRGLIGEV
ncbi:MAG: transcription antitermination factor NusB [Bacteroidales bacterium]|nr:transcription antitermination factor NusB [Bacteroidales bacterium]